jgi:general secretion pathway protein A
LFDDDGLRRLHELAEGIPRNVARMANYALLVGAGCGATAIDRAGVEAAHEEIAWPTPVGAY